MVMEEKKMFSETRCYRVDEAAKAFDVSSRTIYRLLDDPDSCLRAVRIRGSLRIEGRVLNEYMQENLKDPLWE